MDVPDVTQFAGAALIIGLRGCSDQGHWLKNNWNHIQLHCLERMSRNSRISSLIKTFPQKKSSLYLYGQ